MRGFTLIEVLIASTILAFAAAAVLSLSRAAFQAYGTGDERTQAYFLVTQGLEIVRSIRDNESLDRRTNHWATALPAPSSNTVWHPVWSGATGRWQLASGGEEIQPDSQTSLHFTRTIRFETVPNLPVLMGPDGTTLAAGISENVRHVSVTVSWETAGHPMSVAAATLLSNWQPED